MYNNQVEKIAKVIFEYVDSKDRKNVYIVHSGVAEDMKTYCHNYGVAKALYNAGYRKIDEGSVVLSKEEYERFQRIENTLKRISTVSPTEAESENKALKETIGIVLAQKRNIWKRYNEKCKEYALAEEKTRKEVLEKINERLCVFKLENKSQEFTDGYTEAIDEVCGRLDEIAKELDIKE